MSVSTKSVSAESANARSARVGALLDDLEQRWVLTQAELAQLREENAKLKQQLAQAPGVTPPETETADVQHPSVEASPSADVSSQEDPKPEPPSPHALLAQWYKRYPQAFFKGHTQPLKVGIHHDLAEREPWSGKLIRRALANYVNLPRYIKSIREGAVRIDLEGNEAGVVDADATRHAAEKRDQQAPSSPSERTQLPKDAKPRAKTPKSTKKAPTKADNKAAKRSSDAEMPQKQLSLEDKLLGLQQKFQSK